MDEEVDVNTCTATIGQLSAGGGHYPLRRVGCPARSQPAWAGLGSGSLACRRESHGSGRPLGVGRGPLPSPFCDSFSPDYQAFCWCAS